MKISIITATFNSEKNIVKTVESVLSQNIKHLEYIIIDNSSSDRTIELVESFHSSKIKVYSELDTGIYNAFNKGLNLATGDIIAFLNSGDYYLSEVLNMVDRTFKNKKIDCIHGNIRVNNRTVKSPKGINSLRGNRIFHPATFMRKSLLNELCGFDEQYAIAADLDLFIRARNAGFTFEYIDEVFTDFELGGKSTDKPLNTISEVRKVLTNNKFCIANRELFCLTEYIKYFLNSLRKIKNKKRFHR